jgi:hypothetical protein
MSTEIPLSSKTWSKNFYAAYRLLTFNRVITQICSSETCEHLSEDTCGVCHHQQIVVQVNQHSRLSEAPEDTTQQGLEHLRRFTKAKRQPMEEVPSCVWKPVRSAVLESKVTCQYSLRKFIDAHKVGLCFRIECSTSSGVGRGHEVNAVAALRPWKSTTKRFAPYFSVTSKAGLHHGVRLFDDASAQHLSSPSRSFDPIGR